MTGHSTTNLAIAWRSKLLPRVGGAILALAWTTAQAPAQSPGTLDRIKSQNEIRLAYREDAAPFSYMQGGLPTGYSVNLCLQVADAIEQELDLPDMLITYVPVTAESRFKAVANGEADLLCEATTATLGRREIVDFSIPTFVSGASLVIKAGGPTTVEALAGEKVGVLGGTTTQKALEFTLREQSIDADVVVVKTHDEGIELLKSGEISAYFGDRTILLDRLRHENSRDELLLNDSFLSIEIYALAMPIDHDFRLSVDRALSKLYRSGAIIDIFAKSFDPGAKPSEMLKLLYRVSGMGE